MALEDFLSLYEETYLARQAMEAFVKDNYNKGVYDTAVKKTEEITGQNPAVDENGNPIDLMELPPQAIRTMLDSWHATSSHGFLTYVSANLEKVLSELGEKKLANPNLLVSIEPCEQAKFKEIAQLHNIYRNLSFNYRAAYHDDNPGITPEIKRTALSNIKRQVPVIIFEKLKEHNDKKDKKDKLDDKTLEMWANALTFISIQHQPYRLRIYADKTKEIEKKLQERLKGKYSDYISASVSSMKDREKEEFYNAVYALAKSK